MCECKCVCGCGRSLGLEMYSSFIFFHCLCNSMIIFQAIQSLLINFWRTCKKEIHRFNPWTKLTNVYIGQPFSVEPLFCCLNCPLCVGLGALRGTGLAGSEGEGQTTTTCDWVDYCFLTELKKDHCPSPNPSAEILIEVCRGIRGAAGQQGSLSNQLWLCLTVNRPRTPVAM